MFKNPIKKYQSGGVTPEQARQQVVQFIIQKTGATEDQVNGFLDKIAGDEKALGEFQQILELASKDDPKGIDMLKQLFGTQSSQFAKKGGKLHDFICKHAKGGKAGCGCKEDGGKVEKAQYGEIVNDSTGKRRVIYHPDGGYAGYVDLTTGKAYNHNDEEMLQPGWYNGKGYPMAHRNATRGNAYEVNTHGRIIENLPEGNQRVLPPADSANFAGLVKQWDMSKIGHATTAEKNGGVVKGQGGDKKIFNLIHQNRQGSIYQSHQWGNPEGHPDNNWTYERLITPERGTLIRRSNSAGYSFMMSSKNPTQEIVTFTPTGELRAVQNYNTRSRWNKENSFHDSANYPSISEWISEGSYAQ